MNQPSYVKTVFETPDKNRFDTIQEAISYWQDRDEVHREVAQSIAIWERRRHYDGHAKDARLYDAHWELAADLIKLVAYHVRAGALASPKTPP